MRPVIVAVAQLSLYVVAVGAVVAWLLLPRLRKVALAIQVVGALVAVGVLVRVAGALHSDPRPFVVDPRLHPLFAHPADNGFPSDHTALAVAVGVLVMFHRRWFGAALTALGIVGGVARVAAHVHHPQDIVAGAVIGLLAALAGVVTWHVSGPGVRDRLEARRAVSRS